MSEKKNQPLNSFFGLQLY